MIPTFIHQFWDRPAPPPDVVERMASWRLHYPGWEHLLWNDATAGDFIGTHFGVPAARCFHAALLPAMRADIFRVAAMLVLGGIYADADMLCIRPVTDLGEHPCIVTYSEKQEGEARLANGFLAAVPGHPLFQRAWIAILANVERKARGKISRVTGPQMLSAVWRDLTEAERATVRLIRARDSRAFFATSDDLSFHRREGHWKTQQRVAGRLADFDRAEEWMPTRQP